MVMFVRRQIFQVPQGPLPRPPPSPPPVYFENSIPQEITNVANQFHIT